MARCERCDSRPATSHGEGYPEKLQEEGMENGKDEDLSLEVPENVCQGTGANITGALPLLCCLLFPLPFFV